MSILKNGKVAKTLRLGAALTLATVGVVGLSTSSQAASASLSPNYLPDNLAAVVVMTTTGLKSPAGTALVDTIVNHGVVYGSATCAATNSGTTMTDASARTVVSATRMSVTMPAIDVTAKTDYNLCVYRVTSGVLLASAKFSVYPVPTITDVAPVKGPQTGGQTVTIEGTNFTSKSTVKWGTTSLTSVKVAKDGLSLTAVTPALTAGGPTGFTVTNEGGAVTAAGGDQYTVVNAITVTPTTVTAGASETLTIKGSGFTAAVGVGSANAFDASSGGVDSGNGTAVGTNTTKGHVYLVRGTYNQLSYAVGANKTNGQVTECVNPAVVSDTEIVCTLDTLSSIVATTGVYDYQAVTPLAAGAYTVLVVNDGSVAVPSFKTSVTGSATVTVGDY
jgi:hypothetical protein